MSVAAYIPMGRRVRNSMLRRSHRYTKHLRRNVCVRVQQARHRSLRMQALNTTTYVLCVPGKRHKPGVRVRQARHRSWQTDQTYGRTGQSGKSAGLPGREGGHVGNRKYTKTLCIGWGVMCIARVETHCAHNTYMHTTGMASLADTWG
jgi:hypothetical protein